MGINLADAEMRMMFAAVVRKFGRKMRLVETSRERDVDVSHDMFTGLLLTSEDGRGSSCYESCRGSVMIG